MLCGAWVERVSYLGEKVVREKEYRSAMMGPLEQLDVRCSLYVVAGCLTWSSKLLKGCAESRWQGCVGVFS